MTCSLSLPLSLTILIEMSHCTIFNDEGYRIGYGAGYYDRYLSDFEGDTVSTVYPCQEMDFTPDSHDIAVRKVITCK